MRRVRALRQSRGTARSANVVPMNTRKVFALSAGVGLLILIPVVVVVALGIYGSSLGGQTLGRRAGSDLSLVPAQGPPGSQITVTGRNWPARSFVSLFMERPTPNALDRPFRVRLAEILVSRSGSFQIETLIPASIIPTGVDEIFIEALGYNGRGDLLSAGGARFKLEPYPNRVVLRVMDSTTGEPVQGAMVHLQDSFGQVVARSKTTDSGEAEFTSIKPGSFIFEVTSLDYLRKRSAVQVPETEVMDFSLSLTKWPNRRLYLSIAVPDAEGAVRLRGVDRSSGLPFEQVLVEPQRQRAPIDRPNRVARYVYTVPSSESPGGERNAEGAINTLLLLGSVGEEIALSNGYPSLVWHVGSAGGKEILFATESSYAGIPGRSVFVVDGLTGEIIVHRRFSQNVLIPRLAFDGSRLYLVNGVRRTVNEMDLDTGKLTTLKTDLPGGMSQALISTTGDALYLLSAREGAIFRLDLATRDLSGPIARVRGATSIANLSDGRIAVTLWRDPSIIVVDVLNGGMQDVIPLIEPAQWVWGDPDGPYIFAGTYGADSAASVQVIEGSSLKVIDILEFRPAG